MAAVAESYDLTLWQEIIANIIQSAAVTVKWTSFPKKRKLKGKQKDLNFALSWKLLMHCMHLFFKKDFSYHAELDSGGDNGSWIRR